MSKVGSRAGFSLAELMVAIAILGLAVAGAMAGWLFVVRGERINSVQQELDMDVRKTLERMKAELRLSSIDKIVFYPEGPGPYSAISFPLARDNDGDGLIELDSNGRIVWDETVIYHVWPSQPHQLRRTSFSPRDETLTPAQRLQQLTDVVLAGHGRNTINGANSRTDVMFENLFAWKIFAKSAVFDAYAPVLQRASVNLGSVLMTTGPHDFTFRVVGKNAASSGYKVGLDTLVVSPSALPREAEAQQVVAQSGGSATTDYRPTGSWSGNHQLLFPANGVGSTFTLTMSNDAWEETNFGGTGSVCENTVVVFDDSLTPRDFVVRLQPPGTTWLASDQTLDQSENSTTNAYLRGAAVRVLIRGGAMPDGGAILNNGPLNFVLFFAAAQARLNIMAAYIAEAASATNYTPDIVPGTSRQLFFSGNASVSIAPGSYAMGMLGLGSRFEIDKSKSYVVSFKVTDGMPSDSRFWTEQRSGVPGCYVIPGTSNPPTEVLLQASWSQRSDVVVEPRLYSVERLYVLAPSNGTFTSQIVDTKMEQPEYDSISWTAIQPAGTTIGLKVRTGDQPDLSDAPPFSAIPAMTSPGPLTVPSKRYVQFQAVMTPGFGGWYVPSLRDVRITWAGPVRVVDLGGMMSMGPDYGIWEMTMDGKPLMRGVKIELTIFKDVMGIGGRSAQRLTSTAVVEVEPRNTGK